MDVPPADPPDPPESGPRIRRELERFAAEYTERAQTWLVRLGAPSEEAEDRVQDALEALWAHRFEVRSEVWPKWLRTAVRLRHEEARRAFRIAEKHAPSISYEAELDAAEAAPGTPEDELASQQVCAALRDMVDKLVPERRAVVELYLFEERRMPEVATELGISEESAWSRWRRARRELREMVERRRERERFAGGVISFGVVLASWRWIEHRAHAWLRLREGLGAALIVASLGPLVAGDARMQGVAGSMLAVATARESLVVMASRMEPADALRASVQSPVFVPPSASPEGTSEPAAMASLSSSTRPFAAHREASEAAPTATGSAAVISSSRRQSARAHLVRARAALDREGNVAKARALLEMYEGAFPEDPYPDQHAALRAALREP